MPQFNQQPPRLPDIFDEKVGQSLTAISGTPEWRRLTAFWRRAISLAFELYHGDLREGLRMAHARDPQFSESDVTPAMERLMASSDAQAVLQMLQPISKSAIGVRQS
jgi:hypothetical protein